MAYGCLKIVWLLVYGLLFDINWCLYVNSLDGEDESQENVVLEAEDHIVEEEVDHDDDDDELDFNSEDEYEEFDDNFMEPEYGEPKVFEIADPVYPFVEIEWKDEVEREADVEEEVLKDPELDPEQIAALKELRKMDRRREAGKTRLNNPNFDIIDETSNLKGLELKLGDVFVNSGVFKEAVREVAISVGREVWFPCNEKGRVKGVCKAKEKGCSWSIWASKYEKNSDSLMLKSMNDTHRCPRKQKNRCANSNWLSKRYTDQLGPGAGFKMSQFMGKVRKDYVLAPSKGQIYRTKRKAEQIVEGSLVA